MGKHSAEQRAYSMGTGVETEKIPGNTKLNNRDEFIREWVQQFGTRPPGTPQPFLCAVLSHSNANAPAIQLLKGFQRHFRRILSPD